VWWTRGSAVVLFNGSGVSNEDVFSTTTYPAVWPKASKLDLLDLITVPVTMLISQISSYMKRALSHSLFLQKGITFEALVRWFGENQSLKPTDYKKLSVTQDLHKIPTFRVPKFKVDTLTGVILLKILTAPSVLPQWPSSWIPNPAAIIHLLGVTPFYPGFADWLQILISWVSSQLNSSRRRIVLKYGLDFSVSWILVTLLPSVWWQTCRHSYL